MQIPRSQMKQALNGALKKRENSRGKKQRVIIINKRDGGPTPPSPKLPTPYFHAKGNSM